MASYTFTVEEVLRSYMDWTDPDADFWTVPLPDDLIDKTYTQFWNFGTKANPTQSPLDYWRVFEDPNKNAEFLVQFEKTFLEKYYTSESRWETPGLLKLKLKSWWKNNAPLYSMLLAKEATDMFVSTNVNSTGDSLTTDETHSITKGSTTDESDSKTNDANTDTPQNLLELDVNNLDYASAVSSGTNHTEGKGTSWGSTDTNGKSDTTSTGNSNGWNGDIYGIMYEWTNSGYTIFLDMFDKLEEELFLQVF